MRRLVDRFYDLMDEDPDYYGIRKLHPPDLGESRNKLFWFLSEWTGGPALFAEHGCRWLASGEGVLRNSLRTANLPTERAAYRPWRVAGADDFVAIAEFGRKKRTWLSQFLDLSRGVPSHDFG